MDPTTGPKRLKLEFAYDAQHRRIAKVVKEWEGDAATGGFTNVVKDRRYVYDGWNMIAESSRGTEARWTAGAAGCPAGVRARAERPNQLDHTTATGTGLAGASVVRTQVWGQDLSGTLEGAGGVGGLLAVRHGGQTYVPLMDGNGNVMGLQGLGGAKDGQTVARYDYDAFGNRITNTAPELGEDVNPFGFSTKFTDEETGLVYYGYRYYAPEVGRWLNRDPIGERGGINLYGMVGNDSVNQVDYLGLVYDVFITREKGFPGHDVLTGTDPFGKDFGRDYTSSSGGWAIFKTEPGKWNKAFPPRNPRDVFIFDTELVLRNSKFEAGKMKGCPCSLAATKENIYSCLDAVTPIGTSGVFHGIAICGHNCRTATIEAIEKCCLKKGQLLNPPVFDWDPDQPWKTKRPWERPDGSKEWNPPTPWKL